MAAQAEVELFKPSGKFYTSESWQVPQGALGPYDLSFSCDFRRIDGGVVVVPAQEPWGSPHVFPATLDVDLLDIAGWDDVRYRANRYALLAHDGQVRRFTGEPYFLHPLAVASKLEEFTDDQEILAAAFLHDVVEDTPMAIYDVRNEFGDRVAELVWLLTDLPMPGNRAERKAFQRARLAGGPAEAQDIKLVDMWHNAPSIIEHDPSFAPTFCAEMAATIDAFEATGKPNPWLVMLARAVLP